jgi:NAD-dependent dihydropyrimidine dehydrogenase PreA subunit/nitroreductase
MVIINAERCTGCETCINVCHQFCMAVINNVVTIEFDKCSTCGQCIAVCPEQALSWNGIEPFAFDKREMPTDKQVEELLKERRTVRSFTDRKIDRPLLEEIVNFGIYAPSHSFDFRIIVVDSEEIMQLIDKILIGYSNRLYNLIKPKYVHSLTKILSAVWEEEYTKGKSKLEFIINRKTVFPTFPAAFVFIVSDKKVPLSLESAQYALYNINLYAQTKGLGCRNLVGNQKIMNGNKLFRKALKLKKNDQIRGAMGIGYPKVKFKNKVEGRNIDIQWNEG